MSTAPADFLLSYLETALWSSVGDGEEGEITDEHTIGDIDADTRAKLEAFASRFYADNYEAINCDGAPEASDGTGVDGQAGHDLWLTRCGHGAGFWDGDWPEPHATTLTAAAKALGNIDLYVGDDGKIYG